MFSRLFQSASTSSPADGASPSLAVALLSEEDQFDTSYVEQGQSGGRSAARKLHKVIEGEVEEGVSVLVYYVADLKANTGEDAAFFDGFCSSTSKMTLVVPPGAGSGGSVERIAQLISFFLPFPFVSKVFLGSTSSDTLVDNLESLSEEQRDKITVLHARVKKHSRLVEEGGFEVLKVEEGLFSVGKKGGAGNGSEEVQGGQPDVDDEDEYDSRPPSPRARFTPTSDFPSPSPIPSGPFKVPKLLFSHPKPCRDFYLYPLGCGKRTCHYSHDYPFTPNQWEKFPRHVKSMICPKMRDQGGCVWGEQCYNGHRCPWTANKCPFKGKCHFLQAGLPHSVAEEGEEEEECSARRW